MAIVFSSLTAQGFLSFAPDAPPVELRDLNVLIGPNGSGKSNLVEVLDVLRAAPGDLATSIQQGGGVGERFWRGPYGRMADHCRLEATTARGVSSPTGAGGSPVLFRLLLGAERERLVIMEELVSKTDPVVPGDVFGFIYGTMDGDRYILNSVENNYHKLKPYSLNKEQSILSQRRDPDIYPELSALSESLDSIYIYRNWSVGPQAPIRQACPATQRSDRLTPSMDNLAVRIMALKRKSDAKRRLLDVVRATSDAFTDFDIALEGGLLQVVIMEGDHSFTAHRLSDGTLRMLALAAILVDPKPGSVIVIEEPELGLHPDLMPTVRDLLLHASQSAQVIVTTHSTVLADAFTNHPECVCVVEKANGSTAVRRLSAADLEGGNANEGLGGKWMSGALGGTRW